MGNAGTNGRRKEVNRVEESSVVASIQDILRDAHAREEEEKLERARAREEREREELELAQRAKDASEARLKAEEAERQHRAHEEERRRVELAALQEATIAKAKMEAATHARLVEIAKQQEHERHLAAVRNDAGKKRISRIATGVGVLAILLAIGGSVVLKKTSDEKANIEREVSELRGQSDRASEEMRRLKAERDGANDPQVIAELERKLVVAQKAADEASAALTKRDGKTRVVSGGPSQGAATVPTVKATSTRPHDKCPKGDSMCS